MLSGIVLMASMIVAVERRLTVVRRCCWRSRAGWVPPGLPVSLLRSRASGSISRSRNAGSTSRWMVNGTTATSSVAARPKTCGVTWRSRPPAGRRCGSGYELREDMPRCVAKVQQACAEQGRCPCIQWVMLASGADGMAGSAAMMSMASAAVVNGRRRRGRIRLRRRLPTLSRTPPADSQNAYGFPWLHSCAWLGPFSGANWPLRVMFIARPPSRALIPD